MKSLSLIAIFLVGAAIARPGGRGRGRGGHFREIKEQIKDGVEGLSCPEKATVFDAYLQKDLAQVAQLLSIELPEVPEHHGKGRGGGKREAIVEAVESLDCETKSQVFDAMLDHDHDALEELLGIDLPDKQRGRGGGRQGGGRGGRRGGRGGGRRQMHEVKEQIKEAVDGLSCSEKEAVFTAFLDKDLEMVGELLEIDLPEMPERPGREGKGGEKRQMIKDAVQSLDCETKSAAFDAMLEHDKDALEELLGIDLPDRRRGGKHGKREEMRAKMLDAIEGKTCEQINEIFDAKLNMDHAKLLELTGVEMPEGRSEHKMEKKQERMAQLQAQVDSLDCETKASVFKALLEHDREVLEDLGIEMPERKRGGRGGRRERHEQLLAAIEGKSCAEINEIFDAKLNMDGAKLQELTGVEFPEKSNERKLERKQEKMEALKAQVDGLECEEKAAVFEALMDRDRNTLEEMGIEMPERHGGRGRGGRGRGRGGRGRGRGPFGMN